MPLIDIDNSAIVARADTLGLDLVTLSDEERAVLPEWERIIWVRGQHWYALWDVRKTRGAYNGHPRGIGRVVFKPDDVVIDIGAFAGVLSIMCARAGVARVVAYEPSPAAFLVLRRNAALFPLIIEPRQAAVVSDDNQTSIEFHVAWDGPGTSNSIISTPRHSKSIEVAAVSYANAVAGATVLKIDIEGYEFSLPIFPIAPSIRIILISFHVLRKPDLREKAEQIRAGLLAAGFQPFVDVDLDSPSVFMHEGVYVRP